MKCPKCANELASKRHKGFKIEACPSCQGMFILQEDLKEIEREKDPDVAWLDLGLWRHREKYEALPGDLKCPACLELFHTLNYPASDEEALDDLEKVQIQVCHPCRALWINQETLNLLHRYLESRITSETIGQYFKDLSHEVLEILKGNESYRTMGVVLKLLQYRIFSELPFIRNMILNLPKV